MQPRIMTVRCVLFAGVAWGMTTIGQGQVAAPSPFLPPQPAATAGPTQNAPLEYGGYMITADGAQFRIKEAGPKGAAAFVKMNERDEGLGVTIKQHDAVQNTVTVEHNGRTLVLEERKAKILSSGNVAMMPPPVAQPMPNVAPAVISSVVPNPTPADEQKRLEAVAAEVQRRRALREQAQQQIGGAPGQPVATPQPPQMNQPNAPAAAQGNQQRSVGPQIQQR